MRLRRRGTTLGLYAVTVVGRDRPGVVAEVTRALADRGAIGDSSMMLLSGYLAMTLVISAGLAADRLGEGLARRFPGLAIAVADLVRASSALPRAPEEAPSSAERLPYVLTLHGPSRGDVLPVVTGLLSEAGCAITSMTSRTSGGLLAVVADVDLPGHADVASLMRRTADALDDWRIAFRPSEPAVL
ncbi:ACT domain-containing protein [Microbispora corallina]|uniref:ACT domain-containing protein n=1 Tax=Microbispora corallina TaxID=83302 RepID=UPI0019527FB8|nr:ACT domain-containing protein [Microbispora corallina]